MASPVDETVTGPPSDQREVQPVPWRAARCSSGRQPPLCQPWGVSLLQSPKQPAPRGARADPAGRRRSEAKDLPPLPVFRATPRYFFPVFVRVRFPASAAGHRCAATSPRAGSALSWIGVVGRARADPGPCMPAHQKVVPRREGLPASQIPQSRQPEPGSYIPQYSRTNRFGWAALVSKYLRPKPPNERATPTAPAPSERPPFPPSVSPELPSPLRTASRSDAASPARPLSI